MKTQTPEQHTERIYGIFLMLCAEGFIPAATQLIEDAWSDHRRSEDEETTANLRSLLMQLTCDLDGTEFRHWHHAFENNLGAFRKKARDVVLIHYRRLTA